MEVTSPPHQFSGVSQIIKMSPNLGSGTLHRDLLPRVSWGFTLPLCLACFSDPRLCPLPRGTRKSWCNKCRALSVYLVPPFGVLKALCSIYRNCPREQRDKDQHTTPASHSSAQRRRAWLGVIVRQDVEPHQKFGLQGGSGLGDIAQW